MLESAWIAVRPQRLASIRALHHGLARSVLRTLDRVAPNRAGDGGGEGSQPINSSTNKQSEGLAVAIWKRLIGIVIVNTAICMASLVASYFRDDLQDCLL